MGTEDYCTDCGEQLPAESAYCPACGSAHAASEVTTTDHTGITSWAIGFVPGATGRNILVTVAYALFYYIGLPLLVYAYWRRGGTYRKRTYWGLGLLGGGFVAFIIVAALIGAAVGPVDTTASTGTEDAAVSTPEPEPTPAFSVRIRYSDAWQGALSVTGGGSSQSESISGSGTGTVEITGDVDIISVNAQKQDDSGAELTVQILHNGVVVSEASTRTAYGVAQTAKSF